MIDEEVKTFPVSQEVTVNDVTVTVPWVQRQANGAVIVRLYVSSPRHSAGELLLSEQDLTALDPEERPLRTQVRRFWGYSLLKDVTPAHMQTARFDVGFRADIAATRGKCGLIIAIIRTFRSGEGPRAVGGPWVFKFPIADDNEIAAALEAETARQEAIQRENAQREAARLERIRQENARLEAARLERMAAMRQQEPLAPSLPAERPEEAPGEFAEETPQPARQERERRAPRSGRPERGPRREPVSRETATQAEPDAAAHPGTSESPEAAQNGAAEAIKSAPMTGTPQPVVSESPVQATEETAEATAEAPPSRPARSRSTRSSARRTHAPSTAGTAEDQAPRPEGEDSQPPETTSRESE